jgi:hypothetical protein
MLHDELRLRFRIGSRANATGTGMRAPTLD